MAREDRPGEAHPPRVDFRLVHRWESGKGGATVRKEGPVLRGLEKKLDQLERSIFISLAPRLLAEAGLGQRDIEAILANLRRGDDARSSSGAVAHHDEGSAGAAVAPAALASSADDKEAA